MHVPSHSNIGDDTAPAPTVELRPYRLASEYTVVASNDSERRYPQEYVAYTGPSPSRVPPSRIDALRVQFSPAWRLAAALGAAGGVLAIARYGRVALGAGVALGAAALGHMMLGEPGRPRLERIDIALPTLPPALEGLRIGQISDIHLGVPHSLANARWAVLQMLDERPDLVVLTGDQVMHHRSIPMLTPLLSRLRAPLGVYAIPGNHDHWEGIHDVRAALQVAGIPLLINHNLRLEWRGESFWLVGVDDIWDGELDFSAALRGVPANAFKILLGHAPDLADEAAALGFALQLAGHVHGGHVRLPLLGPLARPRFGRRYLDGLYAVGAMALYVSRGLGGAPVRLACPPEAAIITLHRAS